MATISFDTTSWDSEERSLFVMSVISAALYDVVPAINISGHSQATHINNNGIITSSIELPNAADVTGLTINIIRNRYTTEKNARDAATAAYQAELEAVKNYYQGDPILDADIATIKNYYDQTVTDVNNMLTIADAKAAMHRILIIERNILKLLYSRGLLGPK